MNLVELGKKIRQLREQLGMTQNQLAERTNVSYQQIQKYERGKSQLPLLRFMKIAEALETTPLQLLESPALSRVAEPARSYHPDKNQIMKVSSQEKKLILVFRIINNGLIKESILKLVKSISENSKKRSR